MCLLVVVVLALFNILWSILEAVLEECFERRTLTDLLVEWLDLKE
jgi:hypothetical protein